MPETLPPPVWVADPNSFRALLADLSAQTRIAVDSESNSLHAYREQVCLIQFSTSDRDYLLDPFALTDLSPLAPIFADARIEKIFHAAEYDVVCMRRDFKFSFANIFDTMQAARILGREKVGLDSALAERFNLTVNKRFQKADWAARPLGAELKEYARLDTRYLIPMRDQLQTELEAAGRWDLAREDFRRICFSEADSAEAPEPWTRFAGRRDLSLRTLTILRELTHWRDVVAKKLDRPPFKVMGDDRLISIAHEAPTSKKELEARGIHPRQVERWGADILSAVGRGVNAPLVERTRSERADEAYLKRLDMLRAWRKKRAQEMRVESDIILPKPYLLSLAERGVADVQAVLQSSPWRLEKFGSQIQEIIGDFNEA